MKPQYPSAASSEWTSLKEQLLQFAAVVAVAAIVAFLGITLVEWQKRQALPFCDSHYSESCIPCPENARCIGGDMECFPGFIRHGKFCVRDQEIGKSAEAIDEFIVQKVCGQYSFPRCKWVGFEQLTVFEATEILEDAKLDEVLGINPKKFKLARDQGLEAAEKRLITRKNSKGLLELHCPTDLLGYYKPYWCRALEWVLSNCNTILIIIPLVLLAVTFLGGAYRKHKSLKRAEQLYNQVCEALEEKSRNNESENATWVVASHLRDHLLTLSERQRNAVWHVVEQMVCKDSRIDQYPKLVKGESKVVWEWQVKGALRSPLKR